MWEPLHAQQHHATIMPTSLAHAPVCALHDCKVECWYDVAVGVYKRFCCREHEELAACTSHLFTEPDTPNMYPETQLHNNTTTAAATQPDEPTQLPGFCSCASGPIAPCPARASAARGLARPDGQVSRNRSAHPAEKGPPPSGETPVGRSIMSAHSTSARVVGTGPDSAFTRVSCAGSKRPSSTSMTHTTHRQPVEPTAHALAPAHAVPTCACESIATATAPATARGAWEATVPVQAHGAQPQRRAQTAGCYGSDEQRSRRSSRLAGHAAGEDCTLALPPGIGRAVSDKIAAARRMVPMITIGQAARVLGTPLGEALLMPSHAITNKVIACLAGWGAEYLDNGRTTLAALHDMFSLSPHDQVTGTHVTEFMEARQREAYAKWLRKPAHKRKSNDAMGSSVKLSIKRALTFMAQKLHFPIAHDCTAVKSAVRTSVPRNRTANQTLVIGPRMWLNLSWQAEHADTPFTRGHAGGFEAMIMFCIRFVNAQRSSIDWDSYRVMCEGEGDSVRGTCDVDYKAPDEQRYGRPMMAHARGAGGGHAYLKAMRCMLEGVEDQHFFIRATNSPDGDPHKATAWRDGPETHKRALASLHATLVAGPLHVPYDVASQVGLQSAKRTLQCLCKALDESGPTAMDIGKWSGSSLQTAIFGGTEQLVGAPMAKHARRPMHETYGSQALESMLPAVLRRIMAPMHRMAQQAGAEIASGLPPSAPAVGGWEMLK